MQVQVFQQATPEDAVRIRVADAAGESTLPYLFPLPAWEGVENTYNVRDFALCDALHFMGVVWGEYDIPLSDVQRRLISYFDA